jgi:hypothetical protein
MPLTPLRKGLKRLRSLIRDDQAIDITVSADKRRKSGDFRNALGIRFSEPKGERIWLLGTAVNEHVRNQLELIEVLDYCANHGYLQAKNPRNGRKGVGWAERQCVWPDGTRPRCIELFLPSGMSDLKV